MIDSFLGQSPPVLTALWCASIAFLWQFLGATFLARILTVASKPRLSWYDSMMLGWVMWLPFSGAIALLLIMLGWGDPSLLRGLALAFLVTAGLLSGSQLREIGSRLRRVRTNSERAGLGLTLCWAIVAALEICELAYAAHPQRQYDQLNYHLVVAKSWVTHGRLPTEDYDPHLLIAGPVEYAWAWVRALIPSDLFQIGFGQVALFIAIVPACLMAFWAMARSLALRSRWWYLAGAVSLLPAVLPNGEFLRLAKPNGLLLAGMSIILCAAITRREQFLAWAGGVSLAMIAANQTFWHAAIALGVMVLILPELRRRLTPAGLRSAPLVILVGIFCFGVAVSKSLLWAGSPFYPTDAAFFGSPEANTRTMEYWHRIAAAGESSFWTRPLGAIIALTRSAGLSVWLLVCLFGVGWTLHRQRTSKARIRRFLVPISVFLLAYAALWPLFYGAEIASRFVAAFFAALLMWSCAALILVPSAIRQRLVWVAVLIGISCSGLDVMVRKMFDWNRKNLHEALTQQFPRYATAQAIDRWMGTDSTLLADDPIKFFFNTRVLHETLSPREQRAWQELLDQPQAAAAQHGVKALCIRRSHLEGRESEGGMGGPIVTVWHELAPYGRRMEIGEDVVLYSNCAFRQKPCPGEDPAWSIEAVGSPSDEAATGSYHP